MSVKEKIVAPRGIRSGYRGISQLHYRSTKTSLLLNLKAQCFSDYLEGDLFGRCVCVLKKIVLIIELNIA